MRFLKIGRLDMWREVVPYFGPSALRLFLPKLTWFGLIVSRVRTCSLRPTLFRNDNLKKLDINPGFF